MYYYKITQFLFGDEYSYMYWSAKQYNGEQLNNAVVEALSRVADYTKYGICSRQIDEQLAVLGLHACDCDVELQINKGDLAVAATLADERRKNK